MQILNKKDIANFYNLIVNQFRYSLKIIFANKFIYFTGAAIIFFLLVTTINFFSNVNAQIYNTFYILLLPGILLIFYPTTFGIQNDDDSRMLENIFAIPNYRYKVWLPRLLMIYFIVYLMLLVLALISSVILVPVPVFSMVYELMFPIFFLGSLAFALSTVIRNGNGTAVIMVVLGLVFWISAGILDESAWNIFLNPFDIPDNMSEAIWETVIFSNRLYLLSGTIICLLAGLFNLQKREKFM
jgi:hypothetical protein